MDNKLIWAAGFMDGEGCFTIKRVRYQRDKSKHYYQPYISCSQTIQRRKAIDRLMEMFGGSIYIYKQKGNRYDTIQWAVASKDAEKCVNKLLPYLFIKIEQAKLILKFYDLMEKKEKSYRLKDKDFDNREELFYEMRKYNCKGRLQLKRLNERTP